MTDLRSVGMLVAVLTLGLTSCAADSASEVTAVTEETAAFALLPPAGIPDYQLGGSYVPQADVEIVVRDRLSTPDPGRYSICYINGFQTQPAELELWPENTLLTDESGLVMDPDWPDEALLDTSTNEKRVQILAVLKPWIQNCATAGYAAVEFDNLDSYTRTDGALTKADNLELATDLVAFTHAKGLAAGQKNAAEDAAELQSQASFDFAVSEECAAYDECSLYTDVYREQVIDIEYTDQLPRSFASMCADAGVPSSMILRDRDLVTPAEGGYHFERCT